MAAKTPVAVGTAGYVDPGTDLYIGPLTSGQSYLTNGSLSKTRRQYTTRLVYFSDIDDGDTWSSGISGIVAVFCCSDTLATTFMANADSAGVVTFETVSVSDCKGWVLLFIIDPSFQYGKNSA